MSGLIKYLIVDDEPLARRLIKKYSDKLDFLHFVGECGSALEAIEFLRNQSADLIFLDIEMPELDGLQFINLLDIKPAVILTTAYREYALEGYEYDILDYLLKPISFSRFLKAVNKLNKPKELRVDSQELKGDENLSQDYIFVESGKRRIKVIFERISYIESLRDYVRIHMDEERLVIKEKIGEFIRKLPNSFLRIHRSYIINITRITSYSKSDVEIGRKSLPIGISYKQKVEDVLIHL